MPSQCNVKSTMAYVEVGEFRIFKSTRVGQLNDTPTLFKDQLTRIKVGILYMKPKLLTVTNHVTMLNLGCDCRVCFSNTTEGGIVNAVDQTFSSN